MGSKGTQPAPYMGLGALKGIQWGFPGSQGDSLGTRWVPREHSGIMLGALKGTQDFFLGSKGIPGNLSEATEIPDQPHKGGQPHIRGWLGRRVPSKGTQDFFLDSCEGIQDSFLGAPLTSMIPKRF